MIHVDPIELNGARIEYRTAKEVVASWRDVLFEVWLAPGSAADIRAGAEAVRKHLARTTGQIIPISIVHPEAISAVDTEGRAAIAEQARHVDPRSKASALVILSGGFSGSIIRSIATGLNLLLPARHPNKIFDTMEAASSWLAPYLGPSRSLRSASDELVEVFRQLPKPARKTE
jgi:hypothetical protein